MEKPITKERENRSAEKKDYSFHPYVITPENAHTAIILLESKEPEILCKTLRAITKFAAQDVANREALYDLDAIRFILKHINHPEVNIKRFALKALAQLCNLPKGPEQVLNDPSNLRTVTVLLARNEDIFVQEFASLVLSELTREPVGCEQLVSANILSHLFNRMKTSPDPDVQYNSLKTLSNVLEDPTCASEVTKNPQFNWASLLELMRSKYLAIQLAALRTVDQLICRYKDEAVQRTFRASTGVTDLCDILETYEFRDVHSIVLDVLRNYVETEENASHLYQAGCILRLQAYMDMAMPQLKPNCLSVLTKMANTFNGREALYETNTDLLFCSSVNSPNTALLADAALGVALMTRYLPSAMRMSDTNIIEALCSILNNDQAEWFYVRMNALRALTELCRVIPKAAFSLVEPKTFAALRNINKKYKDTPIEAQRLAVQCYLNLLNYEVTRKAMANREFIQELLDILNRIDTSLKIMTCKTLKGLFVEEVAKDHFTARKGEAVVDKLLRVDHVGLRTEVCNLIAAGVTPDGADVYLELGTVHYMVCNKSARYTVPAWEVSLEAIFRCHPSAKFAYTGRLEVNDFTRDGFYVMKRLSGAFPTLEAVSRSQPPHLHAVLHATLLPPAYDHSGVNIRMPYSIRSKTTLYPESPFADDNNLREMLHKLKYYTGDPGYSMQYFEIEQGVYEVRYREKCAEVSTLLRRKAQLLGMFVADQMSGLSQERDCAMPSVELHLADIMLELHSCVVGLGFVKCGGALERAVLYKVLADRLGLPCALERRAAGHVWCEVAIPQVDPEEVFTPMDERYPAGLLRANYVVDLTQEPGRLLAGGGADAARLVGLPPATPPANAYPYYTAQCHIDDAQT